MYLDMILEPDSTGPATASQKDISYNRSNKYGKPSNRGGPHPAMTLFQLPIQDNNPINVPLLATNVWCTLVMMNDDYAKGAAVVAQTLRSVGTIYPIWCMVTPCVSGNCVTFLESCFDRVVHVPLISHEVNKMLSKKQNEIYGKWIHCSFTKWNVFDPELFPVEKVILLDADMMFLENCDELFNLIAPAATFSSPWADPYVKSESSGKGRTRAGRSTNHYGEMSHGQVVDPAKIRRSFNYGILGLACMVLIEPNKRLHTAMLEILNNRPKYGNSKCKSGFDEQLLAETLLLGGPIYHIHQRFNWIVGKTNWLLNGEVPRTQQFYNGKPWDGVNKPEDRHKVDASQWDDVKQWWMVVDRIIEANPLAAAQYY